jgi:hypothetical protein
MSAGASIAASCYRSATFVDRVLKRADRRTHRDAAKARTEHADNLHLRQTAAYTSTPLALTPKAAERDVEVEHARRTMAELEKFLASIEHITDRALIDTVRDEFLHWRARWVTSTEGKEN